MKKIENPTAEPKPPGHKKLKNYNLPGIDVDDYFRIRVGDYRIIYSIENEQITIFILKIAHRKDAY